MVATASGLDKPLKVSSTLEAVVGAGPMSRKMVIKKVWDYIKEHNLQNPSNKREILNDAKLKAIFEKDSETMFEMNKLISKHLS